MEYLNKIASFLYSKFLGKPVSKTLPMSRQKMLDIPNIVLELSNE